MKPDVEHGEQHDAGGGIRGVYPRGLIEASGRWSPYPGPAGIRGVYPRGLIEAASRARPGRGRGGRASAGSTPAASLKRLGLLRCVALDDRIRGVYPRGLIEASCFLITSPSGMLGIRGVYPRGLIEARWVVVPTRILVGIRGVYPRGLIEAPRSARCRRTASAHPRGLPPRPH